MIHNWTLREIAIDVMKSYFGLNKSLKMDFVITKDVAMFIELGTELQADCWRIVLVVCVLSNLYSFCRLFL